MGPQGWSGSTAVEKRGQIEQWGYTRLGEPKEKITVLEGWGPPGEAETQHGGEL